MIKEIAGKLKPEEITDMYPYASAKERESWEALPEDLRGQLIKNGEQYLNYTYAQLPAVRYMDFCRDGNRSRFEDYYFTRRRVLNALVLAECCEYKGRFLDDIINGVMAICEESGWQLPAHNSYYPEPQMYPLADVTRPVMDLFACETGAQMSMLIYLLGKELDGKSRMIRKRVTEELRFRIVRPYLTAFFGWMGGEGISVNNWTPWCTQNTLIASLLPGVATATEKKKIVMQAAKSLDYFLDSYGEDGCCNEGAGYYRAAGLCLFQAIEVLNLSTNGAFASLYDVTKIKNVAPYIMNVHVGDKYYANFSDCSPTAGRAGVREFLFAKRTGNQEMMQYAADDHRRNDDILLKRSENLYYRVQAAFTEAEIRSFDLGRPAIKKDIYYNSVGILVARDKHLFLAVKSGCNDDSHNHNDTGSITIYKDGKPVLIDVGVETYSRKTFSAQRYEIWTMQSLYHNVVNFGEVMQLAGRRYAARVGDVELKEDSTHIEMELANCYPEGTVTSYVRTVDFVKNEAIRVSDVCAPDSEDAVLTLMSVAKPEVQDAKHIKIADAELSFEHAGEIKVEDIALSDEKLIGEWGQDVYRILIPLEKGHVDFVVK